MKLAGMMALLDFLHFEAKNSFPVVRYWGWKDHWVCGMVWHWNHLPYRRERSDVHFSTHFDLPAAFERTSGGVQGA